MKYDEFLATELQIAAGVIESVAGSLVFRLERTGMHLPTDGDQAMLSAGLLKASDGSDESQKQFLDHTPLSICRPYVTLITVVQRGDVALRTCCDHVRGRGNICGDHSVMFLQLPAVVASRSAASAIHRRLVKPDGKSNPRHK